MKFIADCMLGKLAKWLRILGYDTLYFHKIDDDDLFDKVMYTRSILLTRDTKLFVKIPYNSGLFINSDHVKEQLQQVVLALHLDCSEAFLSRCIACNMKLESVEKLEIETRVPDFIYYTHTDFSHCSHCGKVYWKGSHQSHIQETLRQLHLKSDAKPKGYNS